MQPFSSPSRGFADRQLQEAIAAADENSIVVTDLDNTLLKGDCGEAVFGRLAVSGKLDGAARNVGFTHSMALVDEYVRRIDHAKREPAEKCDRETSEPYQWLVRLYNGLSPADIISAAQECFANGRTLSDPFAVPSVNREMVETIAALRRRGASVLVVSASEIWTVRCAMHLLVNPLLIERGADPLSIDSLHGIMLDLYDAEGRAPAWPHAESLEQLSSAETWRTYTFGSVLAEPCPCFDGKRRLVTEKTKGAPLYMGFGDSRNDLRMLEAAKFACFLPAPGDTQFRNHLMQSAATRSGGSSIIVLTSLATV